MKRSCLMVALTCYAGIAQAAPTRTHIAPSTDGVQVRVYEYPSGNAAAATLPILMFHQGNSNARGELEPIALRFASEGHSVFTADLRSGGTKFGADNASAIKGQEAVMCGAYPDVLAALDLVRRQVGRPAILIGSSYTAALVVHAAADRPADVAGFVSLSPPSGPPLAGCEPEPALLRVSSPGLGIRPKAEIEYAGWIAEQARTWPSNGVPMLVFDVSSHGASMMVAERGKAGSADVLKAVRDFVGAVQNDQAVEIASGEWRLKGEFRPGLGAGPRPAVLLLNQAAGNRKAYVRLAGELARRGISSLRLDLRGHGESMNVGRFVPSDSTTLGLLDNTDADVTAALNWLRDRDNVDPERIGVVGASYSGEMAIKSARAAGNFARAYALLSPGSLGEESAKGMDRSGAQWLFIHGSRERFLKPAAEMVRLHSRVAVVRELDSSKHATDLLAEPLALAAELADWFEKVLTRS